MIVLIIEWRAYNEYIKYPRTIPKNPTVHPCKAWQVLLSHLYTQWAGQLKNALAHKKEALRLQSAKKPAHVASGGSGGRGGPSASAGAMSAITLASQCDSGCNKCEFVLCSGGGSKTKQKQVTPAEAAPRSSSRKQPGKVRTLDDVAQNGPRVEAQFKKPRGKQDN